MLKSQNCWIWTVQPCGSLWRSFRRLETPLTDQGAEENVVSSPLNSSKTQRKSCNETLAKLQNLGHHSLCEQIYHPPGVDGRSGGEALQDATSPGAYGQSYGHEGLKMQGYAAFLPQEKRKLVFADEKKFDIQQQVVSQQNGWVWASSSSSEGRIVTRRQNPLSVMVWTAVTETGRSPLLLVPSWLKLKSQRCIANLLEGCLVPWVKKHSQLVPRFHATGVCALSLFQDYPILDSMENLLIHRQGSLACNLNPLDFFIWSILEAKACSTPHPVVEAFKAKLVKEWAAIPQVIIRAACAQIEDRS